MNGAPNKRPGELRVQEGTGRWYQPNVLSPLAHSPTPGAPDRVADVTTPPAMPAASGSGEGRGRPT